MDIIRKFEPLFGEWQVEGLIGTGSFGRVYKIKREEFDSYYYSALKHISIPQDETEIRQLRYDGMDEASITSYYGQMVKDITVEIRLMNKLRGNTNIVSYEDHKILQKPSGTGYDVLIRMELLTNLNEYMLAQQCSSADVIKLGIDICNALELCQKHKVIHRDIKPDNIFVSENGDFKLGDFGVARQLERTNTNLSKKGANYYMAPEAYRGELYNATVDIYSLGIMMYRLLNNNRLPFMPQERPLMPVDREQALMWRLKGETMPLPCNAQNRLGEIILKACAFNPKDRWATPQELRAELDIIRHTAETDSMTPVVSKGVPTASSESIKQTESVELAADIFESSAEKDQHEQTRSLFVPPNTLADKENDRTTGLFAEDSVRSEVHVPIGAEESLSPDTKIESEKKRKKWPIFIGAAAAIAGLVLLLVLLITPQDKDRNLGAQGSTQSTTQLTAEPTPAPTIQPMLNMGLCIDNFHVTGLKDDGTMMVSGILNVDLQKATSKWTDLVMVAPLGDAIAGLRRDGVVLFAGDPEFYVDDVKGEYSVKGWNDIVAIDAGSRNLLALRRDGTVLVTGPNFHGEGDVESWNDIVAISASAGTLFSLGLKKDGTVVATGENNQGQCNTSDWTGIVAVFAGFDMSVGLKSDGTVVVTNADYQQRVQSWHSIVAVSAGVSHIVGLKEDGTVLAVGNGSDGETDVSSWSNIVAVSAWNYSTVGLRQDGTVVFTGDEQVDYFATVDEWTNIVPYRVNMTKRLLSYGNSQLALDAYIAFISEDFTTNKPFVNDTWAGIKDAADSKGMLREHYCVSEPSKKGYETAIKQAIQNGANLVIVVCPYESFETEAVEAFFGNKYQDVGFLQITVDYSYSTDDAASNVHCVESNIAGELRTTVSQTVTTYFKHGRKWPKEYVSKLNKSIMNNDALAVAGDSSQLRFVGALNVSELQALLKEGDILYYGFLYGIKEDFEKSSSLNIGYVIREHEFITWRDNYNSAKNGRELLEMLLRDYADKNPDESLHDWLYEGDDASIYFAYNWPCFSPEEKSKERVFVPFVVINGYWLNGKMLANSWNGIATGQPSIEVAYP